MEPLLRAHSRRHRGKQPACNSNCLMRDVGPLLLRLTCFGGSLALATWVNGENELHCSADAIWAKW